MNEFTGTYHKCNDCSHFWDYNEFNCPVCGSENFEDKEIASEIEDVQYEIEALFAQLEILKEMKLKHGG